MRIILLFFISMAYILAATAQEDMPSMEDINNKFVCPGVDQIHVELKYGPSPAYYIPGMKLILMNWTQLKIFPEAVHRFVFAHECSHDEPEIFADEDAADCAAAKRGVKEGWLTKVGVMQVCAMTTKYPSDETHSTPIVRCANIKKCSGLYE